jgi:hypothetical protein
MEALILTVERFKVETLTQMVQSYARTFKPRDSFPSDVVFP